MKYRLPDSLTRAVQATLEDWKLQNKVQRLWSLDASLWTGADESQWLGWLGIAEEQFSHRERFETIAAEIRYQTSPWSASPPGPNFLRAPILSGSLRARSGEPYMNGSMFPVMGAFACNTS
jgi:hypothetical protein